MKNELTKNMKELLNVSVLAAVEAGKKILEVYEQDFNDMLRPKLIILH